MLDHLPTGGNDNDMKKTLSTSVLALLAGALTACGDVETVAPPPPGTVSVHASAETQAVAGQGDAADDPAIWENETDPGQSLIIGTDKKSGLYVYTLAGAVHQYLPDGNMNNVDLRPGFMLGGREVALVAASNRSVNGVALYAGDWPAGQLTALATLPSGLEEVYGLCMYQSADGETDVLVNDKTGQFEQWRIEADGDSVTGRVVRRFAVASQPEGCVADDETGMLYVGEEDKGIWALKAGADDPSNMTLVDEVANGRLTADVEGLALYRGALGDYLLASSQGSHSYAVYGLEAGYPYKGSFRITDDPRSGIDGTGETDGIAATGRPLGPGFPSGLFVAQDGFNAPSGQNFKLVPFERIVDGLRK